MSLFKGQNTTTRSKKIENFQATACEFGTAVPVYYGRCKTSVNLINYQDFTTTEHRVTVRSGKSKSTSISYYYNCYLECALGDNVKSIGNVWVGSTKYDNISALNTAGNNTEGAPLSVNLGTTTGPTAYMSEKHGDIACSYDGLAFVYGYVFLGEDNASVPSYSFTVDGGLSEPEYMGDGVDANPAYVIKDILGRLNDKLGKFTTDGGYIDYDSFIKYATYCKKADLLVSTPNGKFNEQKKAQEICKELLEITNSYMYWNTDRFVFVPRDDRTQGEWEPNTSVVYDLDETKIALNNGGIIGFKRKESNEVYNHITVRFTNRSNEYEEESVSFSSVDDIRAHGIKSVTLEALWLHTKERAIRYAKAYARKCLTEVNQYTMRLSWVYAALTPGDLIRVTDSKLGLDNQVMMVSEVQEDADGLLTVTAVQRAAGNYSEAAFTVDNNYNVQNFNIIPSSTDTPLFITPPVDLITSGNGVELWACLRGKTNTWGGCSIYVSDKDSNYNYYGKTSTSSTYGRLLTAISGTDTEVNVIFDNPKTVSILQGSLYDAENGNTLIWINGECLSYTGSSLIGTNTYKLTGLIRGQYGTTAAAHNMGDSVAVLDSGIFVIPLTKHYLGRTLYFKFPSFNAFEENEQSLTVVDDNGNLIVEPFTYVVNAADLPNCSNLLAYTKYRELADDVTRYDVIVEWTPPDFDSYQEAQVWYKSNNGGATGVAITDGLKATEIGYKSSWIFGGSGYNTVTIPQAIIGDTYRIAVCTCDIYGNRESPDQSAQLDPPLLVAIKSEIPNTPANAGTSIGENGFSIKWDEVRNADVKYYELRYDTNIGVENANYIGRTTDNKYLTNSVTKRNGTIYIFAVSAYDKFSAPAVIEYNYGKPVAPILTLEAKIQGIQCRAGGLPVNCHSIHWYFEAGSNIADVVSPNTTYYHSCQPSIYTVYACYNDWFGDGTMSERYMVTVKQYIDPALIQEASLGAEKLNSSTQQALSKAITAVQSQDVSDWWDDTYANVIQGNYYTKNETERYVTTQMQAFDVSGELVNYYTKSETNNYVKTEIGKIHLDGELANYYNKTETADYVSSQLTSYYTKSATTSLIEQTADSINNIVARMSEMASSETFKEVKKSIHGTLTVGQVVTWTDNNTALEFYVDVKPGEIYSVSLFGGNSQSWKVWFTDNSNKVLCRGCVGLTSTATTGKNGDNDKLVTSSSTANYTKIADTVTVPKNTAITRMWLFTRCTSDQTTADVAKWASVQKTVYSAITQLADGISLSVTGVSGRSSIDLTQGTLTLNTDLLQVGRAGAMTSIANGAIKTSMLEADCVTADKIDVTDLSAITGTFGTFETLSNDKLGKVIISGGLISVYSRTSTSTTNWVLRVRLGIW